MDLCINQPTDATDATGTASASAAFDGVHYQLRLAFWWHRWDGLFPDVGLFFWNWPAHFFDDRFLARWSDAQFFWSDFRNADNGWHHELYCDCDRFFGCSLH